MLKTLQNPYILAVGESVSRAGKEAAQRSFFYRRASPESTNSSVIPCTLPVGTDAAAIPISTPA